MQLRNKAFLMKQEKMVSTSDSLIDFLSRNRISSMDDFSQILSTNSRMLDVSFTRSFLSYLVTKASCSASETSTNSLAPTYTTTHRGDPLATIVSTSTNLETEERTSPTSSKLVDLGRMMMLFRNLVVKWKIYFATISSNSRRQGVWLGGNWGRQIARSFKRNFKSRILERMYYAFLSILSPDVVSLMVKGILPTIILLIFPWMTAVAEFSLSPMYLETTVGSLSLARSFSLTMKFLLLILQRIEFLYEPRRDIEMTCFCFAFKIFDLDDATCGWGSMSECRQKRLLNHRWNLDWFPDLVFFFPMDSIMLIDDQNLKLYQSRQFRIREYPYQNLSTTFQKSSSSNLSHHSLQFVPKIQIPYLSITISTQILQLMASKYLQKYPVPAGFEQILHDFTREVLRDQPDNIVEYAAGYFEMLEQGKKFEYESKFNVKKAEKKTNLEYNSKAANDISSKAKNAVNLINQNIEKQQAHPHESAVPEKQQAQPYENVASQRQHQSSVGVETQKVEEKPQSSHSSHRKHPSIQDVTKNEDRPVSGLSKKSEVSVGYQPSTNTMMNTEGRKFINQVNSGATKEVVNTESENIEQVEQVQQHHYQLKEEPEEVLKTEQNAQITHQHGQTAHDSPKHEESAHEHGQDTYYHGQHTNQHVASVEEGHTTDPIASNDPKEES